MTGEQLSEFVKGYLECVRFCGVSQWDDEDGGASIGLDDTKGIPFDEDAMLTVIAESLDFVNGAAGLVHAYTFMRRHDGLSEEVAWQHAGSDFYLTRNGHGAGFWDRGLGIIGDKLTEESKPYGDQSFLAEKNEDGDFVLIRLF